MRASLGGGRGRGGTGHRAAYAGTRQSPRRAPASAYCLRPPRRDLHVCADLPYPAHEPHEAMWHCQTGQKCGVFRALCSALLYLVSCLVHSARAGEAGDSAPLECAAKWRCHLMLRSVLRVGEEMSSHGALCRQRVADCLPDCLGHLRADPLVFCMPRALGPPSIMTPRVQSVCRKAGFDAPFGLNNRWLHHGRSTTGRLHDGLGDMSSVSRATWHMPDVQHSRGEITRMGISPPQPRV